MNGHKKVGNGRLMGTFLIETDRLKFLVGESK